MGNRASLQGYFAAVTAMDRQIGRLLDWLEARGLRERTLVVFVSDNGFSCGQHGFWGKGNGTSPRNMFENSIRVPALFSHPGALPQGHVAGAMVSAYDFLPTLLEYLGLPAPQDRPPPRALLPPRLAKGEEADEEGHEAVVIFDEYGPVRMIRTGGVEVRPPPSGRPPRAVPPPGRPGRATQPGLQEPGQGQRIEDLRAQMEAWFAR